MFECEIFYPDFDVFSNCGYLDPDLPVITKTSATPNPTPPGSPAFNTQNIVKEQPTNARSNLLIVQTTNSMSGASDIVSHASVKSNSKNLLSPQLSTAVSIPFFLLFSLEIFSS